VPVLDRAHDSEGVRFALRGLSDLAKQKFASSFALGAIFIRR
jgi:hypothetical protein